MWTLILSLCSCVTLVMSLAFCLCWRKKTPKNELLGLDGMVKQKNPDENVNHLPSPAPCITEGTLPFSGDCVDANKSRAVPVTNTRRSLPDIPSEQITTTVNWEPTGDNSSEHYATVGQFQNTVKRHTLPNGIEARTSVSQHSSLSQADDSSFSPYERVKYDKINSREHPYAQVQPSTSRGIEENQNAEERTSLLRVDGTNSNDPGILVNRSRRSSAQSSLEIPAASAVAGGVAASPELPYMTPPVTQPNFSGDSQDSSKGYTSISVREPLANIIAQTKEMNKKRDIDPHYATVSDDSDDVYTTIPDPGSQIYTSESETYARIPAHHPITVEVEVNPIPAGMNNRSDRDADDPIDDFYEPAPQPPPPSVDSLKQVTAQSHSRQENNNRSGDITSASSSSSVANISSPKPEKRQANSPLPPPPSASSFDFHVDKLQVMRNLDDLYAKVHKNKRKCSSDEDNSPEKPKLHLEKPTTSNYNSSEGRKNCDTVIKRAEHNYETLRKSPRKPSDPGYEKIKNDEPGYASINGPSNIGGTEPGYEVLKLHSSELDPNYEELQDRSSNASDCIGYSRIKDITSIDGYSVVNKQRKSDEKSRTSSSYTSNSHEISLDEPNYESMPSESNSDPNYAAVKSTGSESDPNYESVKYLDEPPYERLDDDSIKGDSDLIGYERVRGRGYENIDTSESSNGKPSIPKAEPPYEQLHNDTDSELPGYEKIRRSMKKIKSSSNESSSSSGKCDEEPNYSTIKSDIVRATPANVIEEDGIFEV